ncbi:MAG: hypothetical protein QOJ16_3874, partial [Acidobacteriota bacterium]|nr:hypothetical protein [Acidobacteriota bacterium]
KTLSGRGYPFLLLFVSVLALTGALPAGAAPRWIPIGPEGGTVPTLVIDPATPGTVYAGTDGGGVWKSVDGGASWSWSSLGMGNVPVRDLALDPRTSSTLYAATDFGFAKSVDGGATWAAKNDGIPAADRRLVQLAVDPRRSGVIYAASPFGLVKSVDGGESWQSLSGPFHAVNLLALDPVRTATLYAATDLGLYKSTDGGATWRATGPLPVETGLTALLAAPGVVYAAVLSFAPDQPVLFASRNGGASWSRTGRGLEGRVVHALAVSPRTGALYAGTPEGIFRGLDGGATFQPVGPGGTFLSFALAPGGRRGDTVYAGAQDLGVFKSADGGRSWRAASSGLLATEVAGLALGPATEAGLPGTLYAASPNGQAWRSDDSGRSFAAVAPLPLPVPRSYFGALAVDPSQPFLVYAGLQGFIARSANGGLLWRRKTGGGVLGKMDTREILVDPEDPRTVYAAGRPYTAHGDGCATAKSADRGESWTCIPERLDDLVLDPLAPRTLYGAARSGGVRKSTDGGATWRDASAGLAGPFGNVFVSILAPAPSASGTLYAGGLGGIFKTTDGGAVWAPARDQGLPLGYPYALTRIAVDPADPQVVYAVDSFVGNSLENPTRARVYRSTDGAATWSLLSDGLPRVTGTSRLVTDPRHPGVLYLGTLGRGVYELVP